MINCPECHKDNPADARFCSHCGVRLPLCCPHCGAALADDARFCSRCGQPVYVDAASAALSPGEAEGVLQGERRTITAMFADVKGSTSLAEQIDVEAWVEIMSLVLQVLSAEIHRYGGEVDRYEGDGLVAFFGARAVHEDDAERAVLAALAMQEAVQGYAAELAEREPPVELLLRVGLSTGQVVTAHLEDARQHGEETAMGRAIAVAARMEPAAEPGTVLVSEDTYRLVSTLFEWQAMGEVDAKGIREPVAAYRPLAHRATMGKGRGVPGLASPLVGRDAELRALQEAIDRLRSGIGGIVTVVGEAGIGKSRLVAEVREWANYSPRSIAQHPERSRGAVEWDSESQDADLQTQPVTLQWVEGRCLSYVAGVAYGLWLDTLRGWLDVALDASPVDVREALRERVWALCLDRFYDVYPYLGRMMALSLEEDAEAKVRGLDGESLQYLTFRAVETLLSRMAAGCPLVVSCEDLHWADPTSLALLEQLLSLTDRVPLLFVCVLRPERAHGCWQIVEAAARDYAHCHTDLRLGPLSAAESATLVGNLLHVDDLPEDLRGRILDHGEGNPFYVEEILRSLIDGGIVAHDGASGHWQATRDVDDIPIPDTLHGVLASRIDRLPEETRRVLQQASVIGRIFSYPVLSVVANDASSLRADADAHLLPHLVALERAQLIRERARVPEREYAFKHHLTQEAAYSGLLRRERRVVHRRVAEALERLYPERIEEQLGLLAHHWERAGEAQRAVAYLHRAGEQAAAQYANEEAIAHLSRALELAPQDDLERRYALLLAREGIYDVQGAREAQREDLAALAKLAQAMEDNGRRAEVSWCKTRYAVNIADHPAAIAAAREAVDLAQAANDVWCEAAAREQWGWVLARLDDLEEATLQAERALVAARAGGPHEARSYSHGRALEAAALRTLGHISTLRHDYVEARVHFEEALRIYREVGDRRGEGKVLQSLGSTYRSLGDRAQARDSLEQSLRLCREVGDRAQEGWTLGSLGWVYMGLGEYSAAHAHAEQALAAFRETGQRAGEGITLGQLGSIYCRLGDYATARAYFEGNLRIRRETGQSEAWTLRHLARVSHYLGDDRAALEYSQRALRVLESEGRHVDRGSTLTYLGHALVGLGQLGEGVDAYRQALSHTREWYESEWPDPAAGLARTYLAQGDRTQALAHVEEILQHLSRDPRLEHTREPLHIYLTCYQVLHAHDDPRATEVLDAGYQLLQERALKIEDQEMRRSYLENVPYHREIVEAWTKVSGGKEQPAV